MSTGEGEKGSPKHVFVLTLGTGAHHLTWKYGLCRCVTELRPWGRIFLGDQSGL